MLKKCLGAAWAYVDKVDTCSSQFRVLTPTIHIDTLHLELRRYSCYDEALSTPYLGLDGDVDTEDIDMEQGL